MSLIFNSFLHLLPAKLHLQLKGFKNFHHFFNLKNPKTFQEKIQWLKLYYHKPEFTMMVDKVAAKEYVASVIGDEYIIPTIGVWDKAEDIDFQSLPEKFVLKTSHDSGTVQVCSDKNSFNKEEAIKKLNRSLHRDFYLLTREYPYKNVERKILAETFIESGDSDLTDYKIFCFDGKPKYIQVIQGRSLHETIDFFDTEWNHQEFVGFTPNVKNHAICPERPENFDKMLEIAESLAKNLPFVRIDLYNVKGEIYFGEITFSPLSGMGKFYPEKWNNVFGELINLPKKTTHNSLFNFIKNIIFCCCSTKLLLHLKFWSNFRQWGNFSNPQTFSEKIQWLKIHDHNPEYSKMVDKLAAKEYVSDIIGKEHIIPALKIWDKPEEIDFDELPERYVLKVNHDSGTSIVVDNKYLVSKVEIRERLKKYLARNYYKNTREWPYKNIERHIFAEANLDDDNLKDYKFFCFDGEPLYCEVCQGRKRDIFFDFFDMEWNHLPFTFIYPLAEKVPERPPHFEEMRRDARRLAKDYSFVRIDFYDLPEQYYFGEITFYPASGLGNFNPQEWDLKFGNHIHLKNEKNSLG